MKTAKSGVHFTHTAHLSSVATTVDGVAQESWIPVVDLQSWKNYLDSSDSKSRSITASAPWPPYVGGRRAEQFVSLASRLV